MKKSAIQFLLCAGLLATVIPACKKDQPEPETDTQSASDNSVAESEYSNVFNEANEALTNSSGALKTSSDTCSGTRGCNSCVNWSSNHCNVDSFPKIITLDYGTTGCVGCDGKTRTGKLVITLTGKWSVTGSTATIVKQNYTVNGNKFDGQVKYTNLSTFDTSAITGSAKIPKFRKEVSNGSGSHATITFTTGETAKWKCDRTIEMYAGHTTPLNRKDDSFRTWGTADGVNRKGRSFTISVLETTALKKSYDCKWILDGKLEIAPLGLATRALNFAYPNAQGSGICDNQLEITVNGKTKIITLP